MIHGMRNNRVLSCSVFDKLFTMEVIVNHYPKADSFFAYNVNNSVIVGTGEVIVCHPKVKQSPTFETSLEVAVESR